MSNTNSILNKIKINKGNGLNCNIESGFSQDNTKMVCEKEDNWISGVPHRFAILFPAYDDIFANITFQDITENDIINGINEEDLLVIVAARLMKMQESDYRCKENADALEAIALALSHLKAKRDRDDNTESKTPAMSTLNYLSTILKNK